MNVVRVRVSGRIVRFCTLRIFKIIQTPENIEITDDTILFSLIRLSKKMSVYFDAMRRRKGQDILCCERRFLGVLWVFLDTSARQLAFSYRAFSQ